MYEDFNGMPGKYLPIASCRGNNEIQGKKIQSGN
jgi:hypothetical protein